MNINVDDPILSDDQAFQEFIRNNPGRGYLKVRATSANDAIPVAGVEVTVSKKIGNNNVAFFQGQTDNSGMINGIVLATPSKASSDLEAPSFTDYELRAIYEKENFDKLYKISLCCRASVIQYINIIPNVKEVENGN